MKLYRSLAFLCLITFGLTTFAKKPSTEKKLPQNIIFMIVDGMGPSQIEAGEIYLGGQKIRFREFPFQNEVTTHNASNEVTDSAAAATAMATGHKVANGVISEARPGDGSDLKTMLERAKELGKSTGLVTTTKFTDATPAAFGAHTASRANKDDILEDYFSQTYPNVLFGSDEPKYRDRAKESRIPYKMATSKTELEKLSKNRTDNSCRKNDCPHYYGGFGSYPVLPGTIDWNAIPLEANSDSYATNDIPHLSEMASAALALLSQNKKGFFLMLESGLVDWIGHANHLFKEDSEMTSSAYALGKEFQEMNRVLDVFLDFQKTHPDTLIVVTADHETGGLLVNKEKTKCMGQTGCLAKLEWSAPLKDEGGEKIANHTNRNVGVYAIGPGAEVFGGKNGVVIDNTEFSKKIFGSSIY